MQRGRGERGRTVGQVGERVRAVGQVGDKDRVRALGRKGDSGKAERAERGKGESVGGQMEKWVSAEGQVGRGLGQWIERG